MSHNIGFPPIAEKNARILILGSMPGIRSLTEHQYYAHPRNAFWPIMIKLFNNGKDLNYKQRKQLLLNHHIALWDVLKGCYRKGSLDSNIDYSSIEQNDFNAFFTKYTLIKTVFFNGKEAEKLFKKGILKNLNGLKFKFQGLPSTSPAYAAMRFDDKFTRWRVIKEHLIE